MDGYAVRAADTSPPRALTIAGELAAGDVAADALAPGTALGITTGAALPPGADAILRVEDASVDGDRVTPAGPVAAGTHVRYRGEDVGPRATCSRPPGPSSGSSTSPRSHRPASARSPCTGAPSCTCSPPVPSCWRWARRRSRAGSTSPTG